MIKAIIFDLNGIFIQSSRLSDRFEGKFGVPSSNFLPALKEILSKARMPNAGDSFSYWKPYLDKWGTNLTREEFFDFWFSAEKDVPEIIDLVKEIKEGGVKIFILSNNFAERANYYRDNFSFIREIPEKIYYSWQTGFVKPNPQAYRKILEENDLQPEECLYFDDSQEHADTANSLGIKSFRFAGIYNLKEIFKSNQLIE